MTSLPATLLFDPATVSATRALLLEIGVVPNRLLGQNFLTDKSALDRIVQAAQIGESDSALEIGPGLGGLTCRLAAQAMRVAAIEKDSKLVTLLRQKLPASNLNLIEGDALRTSWDELELPANGVKVVANLPYSISKPMLRRLLEEWRPHLQSATLMLQREVAERILAAPGTSAYGPIALMSQLYARPKLVFHLGPGAFYPPPSVSSSVVYLEMRVEPSLQLSDEKLFWRVVRAAFGMRRKQLVNTLRSLISERETLQTILQETGIDPQRRGETLSLQEFADLSNRMAALP